MDTQEQEGRDEVHGHFTDFAVLGLDPIRV